MKKLLNLFCLLSLTAVVSLRADTLFSPGSITIGTNQAILITTMGDNMDNGTTALDGAPLSFDDVTYGGTFNYAIAGSHTLSLSNPDNNSGSGFITYQILNGSSIKTIFLNDTNNGSFTGTNSLFVPAGKTVQFFTPINYFGGSVSAVISSQGSTNTYNLIERHSNYNNPAVSGPATITFSLTLNNNWSNDPFLISYYFTDEILQVPPQGYLKTPAPALEVDVQKSYDLTTWTNVGAFNTSAEAGAFYRLKILQ